MDYPDYYRVLGVRPDAPVQTIRKAYHRLARQYHPDVNPGDPHAEETFKLINEAYHVLSDTDQRAKYDQLGDSYRQWHAAGEPGAEVNWSGWANPHTRDFRVDFGDLSASSADSLGDLMRNFFSGLGRHRTAEDGLAHGQDLEITTQISLEEAYYGTERRVLVENDTLDIRIPPGVQHGTRLCVSGYGLPAYAGGQPGDLFVIIHEAPHPRFRRSGDDLNVDLKIPLLTAVLGGTTYIPTLEGRVSVDVQPGLQSGKQIRLRGHGMPRFRQPGHFGDLYAHVLVQVPQNLTPEEQQLFERLRQLDHRSYDA